MSVVSSLPGQTEDELLRLAASLEQGSEHPLAAAVVSAAKDRGLALSAVSGFQSGTGRGVSGQVDGKQVLAGNETWLQGKGNFLLAELNQRKTAGSGQTVIFVAVNRDFAGYLAIADPIKPSAGQALRDLKSRRFAGGDAHRR